MVFFKDLLMFLEKKLLILLVFLFQISWIGFVFCKFS